MIIDIERARNARVRSGPAESWESTNLILRYGEIGIETDTGQMKAGDGVLKWNDLDYIGQDPGGGGDGSFDGTIDGGTP